MNDFKNNPESMNIIFAHMANGGSLVDLCETWGVKYSSVAGWVNCDPARKQTYQDAIKAQNEWACQRILHELRSMAFCDVRKIFKDDGSLTDPAMWPDAVAKVIDGLEVVEEFSGRGAERTQVGWTKKVKLSSRLRALELLMKNLNMLTDRVEVSGKVSLEDLVSGSINKIPTEEPKEF
jgi:hypothetical protein